MAHRHAAPWGTRGGAGRQQVVPMRENLLITRPACSQTKTPCWGCCSTRISVSLTHYTFRSSWCAADAVVEAAVDGARVFGWGRAQVLAGDGVLALVLERLVPGPHHVSARLAGARAPPNRKPNTLHPTPCTLHPTPYTLHPTPYTLHPTPYTLHPTP